MATPLDLLKARLGIRSTDQTELLQWALDVATAWVQERVFDDRPPECQEAIMLLASRLYARRNSPEGVAGWGDLGVVRIIARDPDIAMLLVHHLDMTKAGVA